MTAVAFATAVMSCVGYQPTATTMYCGLFTEMSEDWPATSSYGKPYARR